MYCMTQFRALSNCFNPFTRDKTTSNSRPSLFLTIRYLIPPRSSNFPRHQDFKAHPDFPGNFATSKRTSSKFELHGSIAIKTLDPRCIVALHCSVTLVSASLIITINFIPFWFKRRKRVNEIRYDECTIIITGDIWKLFNSRVILTIQASYNFFKHNSIQLFINFRITITRMR